jgi:hypothetical protein
LNDLTDRATLGSRSATTRAKASQGNGIAALPIRITEGKPMDPALDSAQDHLRVPRCQVLVINRRGSNRCSDPATDPEGEILICQKHTARVVELLAAHGMGVIFTTPEGATS